MRESENDRPDRLPLRPVEFLVLAVLQREPLHGYGLVRRIEERTEGQVRIRPGDLYRVLYRLSRRGLLEAVGRGPVAGAGSERRTYYRITAAGRTRLLDEATLLSRISADVLAKRPQKVAP
jgi:DNA-binding PadR family transcriptional regulator